MENNGSIYKICGDIESRYNDDVVNSAFTLLLKLFQNIINNPNELKFRQFKKSNEAIKTKILIIHEIEQLIKEIGYQEEGSDVLIYKDPRTDKLKKGMDIIGITHSKLQEKQRAKEILKKNNELNKLTEEIHARMKEEARKKQDLVNQMELDKKERATNAKATDSKANELKFGANVKKFECKQQPNQRG